MACAKPSLPLTAAVLSLDDERAKHITRHLRKTTGDTVQVGVVNGGKHSAEVILTGTQELKLVLGDEKRDEVAPGITLLLALPLSEFGFPMARLSH